MDKLLKHNWHGNIRELLNSVERSVVLSSSEYIDEDELSLLSRETSPAEATAGKERFAPLPLEDVVRHTIVKRWKRWGATKAKRRGD